MMCKGKIVIVLSLFVFNSLTVDARKHVSTDIYKLNQLLINDYNQLQRSADSEFLKALSSEKFIDLFYEGIEESIYFFKEQHTRKQKKSYKHKIRETIMLHKATKNEHKIASKKLKFKMRLNKNLKNNEHIFNFFSGKWYGYWESNLVNHNWLTSQKFPQIRLPYKGYEVSITLYQSVFTGDGLGWNYQINLNGKPYLMGFVCHFDKSGNLYMKRPHLGVLQPNDAIVWITKDHIYYEFVCNQNKDHKHLPKHYVITGAYFNEDKKDTHTIKLFQEIYTENAIDRIALLIDGIIANPNKIK